MSTDLARPTPFTLTPTGLLLSEDLTEEEWDGLVTTLQTSQQALGWAIGDLWAFGEQRNYGKAADFAGRLGISTSTLKTYGSVARSIPASSRLADLSFSHHQEVAGLDPEKRDAILAQAAAEGLGKADVRRLAKGLPVGAPDNGSSIDAEGREVEPARAPSEVSSEAQPGFSWEEHAVGLVRAAGQAMTTALEALKRPEFRLTAPVAQAIVDQLAELDGARDEVINVLDWEVGGLMTLPKRVG